MARLDMQMFSESRIQLAKEVKKHPTLMNLLNNHKSDDFELMLAEISLYCDVILHGDYTQKDLDGLCDALIKKLMEKRLPLILTSSGIVTSSFPNQKNKRH